MEVNMAKQEYSVGIGVWKSVKNVFVTMGIPMIVLFIDNYTQIIPSQYTYVAAPIIGLVSYFVKNYLENKK
jgi:hypothetical protein